MSQQPKPSPGGNARKPLPAWLLLLASYRVAFWTFVGLLLITWLGTLYQTEHGLLEAQRRYFESWIVLEPLWFIIDGFVPFRDAFALEAGQKLEESRNPLLWLKHAEKPLSLPLPGGVLLMLVLGINLLGGVVRILWRWQWSKLGALGGHLGVLMLLAAALLSFVHKKEGYLELEEGQEGNLVRAYASPVIAVRKEDAKGQLMATSYQSDPKQFTQLARRTISRLQELHLQSEPLVVLSDSSWPFEIEVIAVLGNAIPALEERLLPSTLATPAVEGVSLAWQENHPEAERNQPGALVRLVDKKDGSNKGVALLSQLSVSAHMLEVAGERWWIDVRPESWTIPFALRLERAYALKHPGTEIPSSFESEISLLREGQAPSKRAIYMNHPLRTDGYAIFQAKMSTETGAGTMSSTFEVVKNPSDQWPMWSCWVIAISLLAHFVYALLKGMSRRRMARC